jgi:hypothetical protein
VTTSAPRKTPARTPVKVALDLDKLEHENATEPFAFKVAGRSITLLDPSLLDWQVAATIDARNPHSFFGSTMTPEDFDFWVAQPVMEMWKVEKVVQMYRDHFGLPDPNSGE